MNKKVIILLAFFAGVFALLTLFMSSSVIFNLFGIREKQGNYVLFVVWANFICGLLYLLASYGFFTHHNRTYQVLGLSLVILIFTFAGLLVHINSGGLYETKTIGALVFRIVITSGLTAFAYFIKKGMVDKPD